MPKKGGGINTKSTSSDNPNRKLPTKQKAANMRDRATIKRLNMYRGGKAVRDKKGKILGGTLMSTNKSGGQAITGQARIQPDRRWFGNTRVIGQKELDAFREQMTTAQAGISSE